MKVIYGIDKVKRYKNAVVALGVFDGVHLAHRRILKYAVKASRAIRGTSIAVTFWPHPQKKKSLYSLEHRLRLIAELEIDVCVVVKFNRYFARVSADHFIRDILVEALAARYICVGRNFRFGYRAEGDVAFLKKYARPYNFKLKVFDLIRINRSCVSSTYIRNLITSGSLAGAQKLLGRRVSVFGTVIKGSSLAKRLGFPTANIDPHHEVLPPPGVYAAYIFWGARKFAGLCYIGKQIEAHIFDFRRNIYGEDIEIQFIKKIRSKKEFSSQSALVSRIKKDALLARTTISG